VGTTLYYRFLPKTALLAQYASRILDFFNEGYINSVVWVTLNHEWSKFKVARYVSFFYLNNDYLNPALNAFGQFETRNDNVVGVGVVLVEFFPRIIIGLRLIVQNPRALALDEDLHRCLVNGGGLRLASLV